MYKIEYGIFIGQRVKGIQRPFVVTEIETLDSLASLMERLGNLFSPIKIRMQDIPHLLSTSFRPRTHIVRGSDYKKGFRVIMADKLMPHINGHAHN